MCGFFLEGRRRVGMVALVLACLFMGAWMRSRWIVDEILCVIDRRTLHAVYTCPIGIGWGRLHETTSVSGFAPPFGFRSLERNSFALSTQSAVRPFNWTDPWDSQLLGFRSGIWESRAIPPTPLEVCEIRVWIAPFWVFVCPLTLISAWLLFDFRVTSIRFFPRPSQ